MVRTQGCQTPRRGTSEGCRKRPGTTTRGLFGVDEAFLSAALLPTVDKEQYRKYEGHDPEGKHADYEVDHKREDDEDYRRHSEYLVVAQIEVAQSKEEVQYGCDKRALALHRPCGGHPWTLRRRQGRCW